ncbi:HprK-related kinase B [Marinobacter oulmenensis]|uniref:HprK-related kinase B n=1 Tax=Marinobacter oulmenensis TaxID=643747 RepID=A0A840UPS0_9GAMM|nr:HprK-related kinase B [Marinobacter oulmenensis]MBB5322608.1 HprK-related kinase B [Marinobacter oulmenensis]
MIDIVDESALASARARCCSELTLVFVGIRFRVVSDSPAIVAYLRDYYSGLTSARNGQAEQRIFLINDEPGIEGKDWAPVKRSKGGSRGAKEAYFDVSDGRWIHKLRTGMVMFQSLEEPMAIGDLCANRAQVVNFINNQFLNQHQREGYLLGHASAFEINGQATAIAAGSGGGKSTLMLRALEVDKTRFLSNDRILFRPEQGRVRLLGLAKYPRVNPGTLLHSERLAGLLSPDDQARFAAMTSDELWDFEQKSDVMIPEVYGEGRTAASGNLRRLILLDWSRDASVPTQLVPADIHETPEILEGLRKSPGPFYQDEEGTFPPEKRQPLSRYVENLPGVEVLCLTGKVDFDRAIQLMQGRGVL